MPSTYSTDLKLELMATGEANNVWGTNTNNNLGTLLEQAMVRSGAVPIADANTTIAITNGTTSPARCYVLALTGALTAQRNLTVPTINKPYVILNGTTGGFGVNVKTAAGTGIVVPNGKRRFVYVDGTNVVDGFDSVEALAVVGLVAAGSLSVGGFTIATAGNVSLAGALTTAAAFTTAGSALTLTTGAPSNVTLPTTGTLATLAGAEVFTNKTLTSPILTTPAIGTPASGVLTNCSGLTDTGLTLSDVTNNNTSTTQHGFAPKLPNDVTKFFNGTGGYTVPVYPVAAFATQAEQETGTSLTVAVAPGTQKFHASAAKAWVEFSIAGAIVSSYNVTSVSLAGVTYSVVFTTAFSSAAYAAVACVGSAIALLPTVSNKSTTGCDVILINSLTQGGQAGPGTLVVYGDQ